MRRPGGGGGGPAKCPADGSTVASAAVPLALAGSGSLAPRGSTQPPADGSARTAAAVPLALVCSGGHAPHGSALATVTAPLASADSGSSDSASVVVQRRWRALCSRRNEEYESCMRTIQADLDPSACDIQQRAFRSYAFVCALTVARRAH